VSATDKNKVSVFSGQVSGFSKEKRAKDRGQKKVSGFSVQRRRWAKRVFSVQQRKEV
jgi:hypothetical protein